MGGKKVIIDVDTGVDDAQAIMMALAHQPDVCVVAITCVNGNAGIEDVCHNTLTVLTVCGESKVPVYRGAHAPLLHRDTDGAYHHGKGGLGGVDHNVATDTSPLQSEHAVNALVRLARENKGELTLVALAPLTNIAMALRMDDAFCTNLKEVVIMGGNVEGRGNITACGEFNFATDPEAAYITLKEIKCPMKLMAWEPCLNNGLDWEWFENIHKVDTAKSKFHSCVTAYSTERKKSAMEMSCYYSCDPTAMVVALHPAAVLDSKRVFASVELKGELTRAQLVVDWTNALRKPPNVEVIYKVDVDTTKACYEKMLA